MLERLPDQYYTQVPLDGVEQRWGIKQPGPVVPQGEAANFTFYLAYEGEPVTFDNWTLEVVVKKSKAAYNVHWRGVKDMGITMADNQVPGYLKITIPAEDQADSKAGTYYVDVIGTKAPTADRGSFVVKLMSFNYNLRYEVMSAKPENASVEINFENAYNLEQYSKEKNTTGVERTLPQETDTSTTPGSGLYVATPPMPSSAGRSA